MSKNKNPELTIKRILETSLKLFLKKGYEHTTIQDIIDDLGNLSKGAIYYHFKSKEDILDAVANSLYADSNQALFKIKDRKDCNGLKKIQLMLRTSLYNPNQEYLIAAAPNFMKNPRFLVEQIYSVEREVVPLIQPLIEEGIVDGSINTNHPQELAEILILLLNIWINPLVFSVSQERLRQKFDFLKDLCEKLGAPILSEDMYEKIEVYRNLSEEAKKAH